MQSWEFLNKLLGPLLKTVLPLMNNVLKTLPKKVLVTLRLTAAAAADIGIHRKYYDWGQQHK